MSMMSNVNPQFKFKRPRGVLSITIGILVVIATALISMSGFYADWLWFKSVNFTSVWSTILMTKIELFLTTGLLTAALVLINIRIAYKRRPLSVSYTHLTLPTT